MCASPLQHKWISIVEQSHLLSRIKSYLSRIMTKPIKWPVRPAKTQISLGICPVWSESSQCAQWVAEDRMLLHADSEDSDQTGRSESSLSAQIILLVLSWGGSFFPINQLLLGCFQTVSLLELFKTFKIILINHLKLTGGSYVKISLNHKSK